MSAPEVRIDITLRWRDMDMLGHLNQAVYHELLEEARGALLLQHGDVKHWAFVLARVELDYRHEVRKQDGTVAVVARVARVGTKSVTVAHDFLLADGTVAASGASTVVAWDPEARRARALTPEERRGLGAEG